MSGRSKLTAIILLFPVFLWTCAESETETESALEESIPEAAPEAAPEPAAEGTIAGRTLTTTITSEEAGQNAETAGTWELDLADNGTYTVRQNDETAVEGTYSVEGDQITLTDTSGPAMCDEYPDGTYRWSIAADQVTMTVLDDECQDRVTVLTAHPHTMQ